MNKFREEQQRLLKELVYNSRLETQSEKVLPFYEDTIDMHQIPEKLRMTLKSQKRII
ncbi:unnamed protein product [Paramecium octaurelia]|uniref:Uncharacterized protein n=1 Tax=Paramecium octaurelia TaxID=43137 RepID=A0A8S1SS89_PAROT|nr:unnamed protein product [Paramecium octaurelia]